MRTDELYIDGELMDLDDDTKVTLDLKSNILTEVSKIVSNNSYTIKLPKTVKNQKIIGHADLVSCVDDYPYMVHSARYFRNGIELIANGSAVLLSVSDSIEICLIWGCYTALKKLIDEGLQLNKLEGDDKIYFKGYDDIEEYPNTKDYFYALIDWIRHPTGEEDNNNGAINWRNYTIGSGSGSGVYRHPVVRVPWLLRKIQEQTGISFCWTGEAKETIDKMLIPLSTKKANELTLGSEMKCDIVDKQGFGDLTYKITKSMEGFEVSSIGSTGIWFTAKSDMKVKFKITSSRFKIYYSTADFSRYPMYSYAKVVCEVYDGSSASGSVNHTDTDCAICRKVLQSPTGNSGFWEWEMNGWCTVELKKGYQVKLELVRIYKNKRISNQCLLDGKLEAIPNIPDEVPLNSYFPIIENLPDIKVMDLVKGLCAVTGTFAKQTRDKVEFMSWSDLYGNLTSAKDWTKKVVASYRDNKPKEMTFKISDYAQHNYYKWKEDNSVLGDYDGDMKVIDNVLDYEKTVITMPFAASDGNNVPIYTENKGTDGSITYQLDSCQPRLMIETGGNYYNGSRRDNTDSMKSYAIFDGMNFETILSDKYERLRNILQRAKIIKEKILISEYDLKDWDESVPVYLGQYGKFFAVIEIKSEDTGLAEVELLEL